MYITLPDASAPPILNAAAETKMAAATNILFSPLLQGNIIGNCVFSLRYDILSRGRHKKISTNFLIDPKLSNYLVEPELSSRT
jgi:hypothetical protein